MKHTRIAARVLLALLWILLPAISGCAQEDCSHLWGPLQAAVPAGFFEEGSIAHYQCADCGALADGQMAPVDTVTVPKLSSDLYLFVNGEPFALTVAEETAERITWQLEDLAVSRGDRITVRDKAGHEYGFTAADGSVLDPQNRIANTTATAAVSLVATPQGLTLSVRNEEYPGIVAQINGEQFPMGTASCPDTGDGAYMYGYVQLRPGDRVTVIDNVSDTAYGYDALAESLSWNIYDYHRGENGELVMDRDARCVLEFSKGGDEKVYITKTFAPVTAEGFQLCFADSSQKPAPMTDTLIAPEALLFAEYSRYADTADNAADIAGYIAENGLQVYSAALFLEAGTQVYIADTDQKTVASGGHLTQVSGASGCFRISGEYIEITQAGTYHIRYLPAHGSISLDRLSAGNFAQAAREFDKRILTLPSGLELYYRGQILSLYRQYRKLPQAVRSQLKTSGKLETLYRNTLALDSASSGVLYYMNTESTNHVYRSREDLMEAFFTDFYYYIVAYHGTAKLRDNGVKSVSDFLKLAKVFPNADETDFYRIGYAAGKHFLESRSNDVPQAQSENGFVGFCYHNGLYREIIPFLIRYFAYWRIDEGYANLSNCGADMFAEGWAPTVDISKFFYYSDTTSPVKSARLIDCFTYTAGVVYGFDPAQPLPDIALRGYIFEGWYDNPQCSGNPVTDPKAVQGQISLYAKWREDTQQQDRDAAALVDVYIYNLTTRKASRASVKVGYVKDMYDALSPNAKTLVSNYATLEEYIELYIKK